MRMLSALVAVFLLQLTSGQQQGIDLIEQGLALLKGTPPSTNLIAVPAGGNLQAALTASRPGDTIVLPAGAVFTGNFVLPEKTGNAPITLTTAIAVPQPGVGQRVSPTSALAVLRSMTNEPALQTAPRAHHWTIALLALTSPAGDVVRCGDGSGAQNSLLDVPHDLIFDRLYIHGDATVGTKRGLALNCANASLINSYVSDVKLVGQDSQAVGGWNGPGPFLIANNYLEAAGENIMFGGSDPAIPDLVPSDIVIRGNHIARPLAWKGSKWEIKNLLELKNARRVTIEGNLFERHWAAAQSGYAIVFTVRNQGGTCPWCQVRNVTFQRNVVRDVEQGVSITGQDDEKPSLTSGPFNLLDNLFERVAGHWLLLTNGPINQLTVARNTAKQGGNILELAGTPSPGAIIRGNLVNFGSYGVHGDDRAVGRDSLDTYLPGAVFSQNTIVGAPSWIVSSFPAGNTFPATWPSTGGVDPGLLPDVAAIISGR